MHRPLARPESHGGQWNAEDSTSKEHMDMADGSTTVTYTYYPDGSYQKTTVFTASSGEVTTTVDFVNAQGQLTNEDVTKPDGGTSHAEYSYYPDGTRQQVTQNVLNADGSRTDETDSYYPDGKPQRIVKDAIAADGSRVDTTYEYQPDGSYSVMTTSQNPAGFSQTHDLYNAFGQLVMEDVITPSGTTHTENQYLWNGNDPGVLIQATKNVVNADGSRTDETDYYNPDGKTQRIVKDAIAADGSRVDTTYEYQPDGSYQVTTTSQNPAGFSQTHDLYNAFGPL
jgi:hypothetical protein